MLEVFPGWGTVLRTFVAAIPGLMVIVVILACVMGGVYHRDRVGGDRGRVLALPDRVVVYRTMDRDKLLKVARPRRRRRPA